MVRVRITSAYEFLRQQLTEIPQMFREEKGHLLYSGRNQIRLFHLSGHQIVVKQFKRHNPLKQVIYTFFRKNKARRSFENAQELLRRGGDTPHPIAYWEEQKGGLVRLVYYACEYTEAQAIRPQLIEQEPFDPKLATAYALFVASLHENGILHRDLNPTNVLYTEQDGQYHFQLIDINRMHFYQTSVPKAECMENLTLFWWLTDVYRFVLYEYAEERGWTEDDIARAVQIKECHDRRWIRRKKFTTMFKHS